MDPYDDGRWTAADHDPPAFTALWCRGNVGEVFPNVMTPMSSSLYLASVARGQATAAQQLGMVTSRQVRSYEHGTAWSTGVFGGYLYGNLTLARSAASRTPGLSVEMIDEQLFGLSDAPAHEKGRGERDPRAAMQTMRFMIAALRTPDAAALKTDQRDIAAYLASVPDVATATDAELLATARSALPWAERMMHHLLLRSARAGLGRSMLEQLVRRAGGADLVNRLTAGLGTIESAEPAQELWALGRSVAADASLTAAFDAGLAGLDGRVRSDPAAAAFVADFDAFADRHAARGPDEWELASPTWQSDPSIALAMIERLRHAPADRDPTEVRRRLASEGAALVAGTRRSMRLTGPLFDRAWRAATAYAAEREATKAAFMRSMLPARRALAELARRSAFGHDDFFLLRFDEVPGALARPSALAGVIAERRARRDELQSRVPPFWFEDRIPDPSTWPRRAEERRPDGGTRTLTGIAVCPGRVTGHARIVAEPSDPGRIEPGDILVAPLTDPAWTPLFLAAAGVVVDVGAQQSHAAIVARELGIPAVVSVTGASSTIPDGATISVDGSRGTVTVH